ncbi:expressed unknown protein [Seminavis robusta]|uniref:Uncharacterized protein n=1 Tax=Seminavis robusta TaxID=568900 RepID=A0A9N8HJJ4_9STRA|nr:expressed unknown protein [Seminavis robusta]|eukprot:Sro555_g165800.1 n/a (227) ;mRNA; r:50721-51401
MASYRFVVSVDAGGGPCVDKMRAELQKDTGTSTTSGVGSSTVPIGASAMVSRSRGSEEKAMTASGGSSGSTSSGSSSCNPICISDDSDDQNWDDGPLAALVDRATDTRHSVRLTAEQSRVMVQMTKMRSTLETHVQDELCKRNSTGASNKRKRDSLFQSINALKGTGDYDHRFIDCMHTLREYGNAAVHARYHALPSYEQCTVAVVDYLEYQKQHSRKKRRRTAAS